MSCYATSCGGLTQVGESWGMANDGECGKEGAMKKVWQLLFIHSLVMLVVCSDFGDSKF